jgi:hypothetical protein
MSDLDDPRFAKGLIPRDYGTHPAGSLSFAKPFDIALIPREEWPSRIASMKATKSRLSDIWEDAKIGVLSQGQIGYCHAFSVAMGCMVARASMGLPYVELSASSVGGPVTGFKNAGAYIFDDLEQTVNFGISSTATYPMLDTKNHWTPAAKQDAALHKVTEWLEGANRNFDQVMTCLLSRIPVVVGLNWWSHAICYLDPIIENGKFGIDGINSWGDQWSYGGARPGWFRFFEGYGKNKATPDEWYALRQLSGA